MGIEIERKFLVAGTDWRRESGTYVCQGYLNRAKERTVRVRIAGEQAFLTIKGITVGATRAEFEYEIPVADAQALMKLCDGPLVQKVRRVVWYERCRWEVDEFLGENEGLVVAEIELKAADQKFAHPPWLGREVTDDPRYLNANLASNPYRTWSDRTNP